MALETLAQVYTSKAEMESLISFAGVDLRLDDLGEADMTQVILEIVEEATDVVNEHCLGRYEATDLVDSRWVHSVATWIGCYLLSQRRGNPALFSERYEQVITRLEDVQHRRKNIPRVPERANMIPAVSNVRVDDRYMKNKVRVERSISTGGTYTGQHSERDYFADLF